MWFGLIPGPYRVVRAFTRPRRTYYRSRNRPATPMPSVTTAREQAWWWTALAAFVGVCVTLGNNPASLPNVPKGVPAPHGWWLDVPTGAITPVGPPVPLGTTVRFIPADSIQSTWAWFTVGIILLTGALVSGIVLHKTRRDSNRDYNPPPSGPPRPYTQPQPAPLPRPDLVQTRSGHKPLSRELPMDRPHPSRTWEG